MWTLSSPGSTPATTYGERMTAYALPLTGQPRLCTVYDWVQRSWLRCVAIDLGRPDTLQPGPDALAREAMPRGNRERLPVDTPRMSTWAADERAAYIADLLAERGPMRLTDIAEECASPKNSVWSLLDRRPGMFRRSGCAEGVRWSLVEP